MLRPTAIKVIADDDYFIITTFDNGQKKKFDVKPYIQGTWYGKLHDVEYFRRVMTDGYTVCWPDGQDLCPDELYELGVNI